MVYLKGLLFGSRGLTTNAIKATIWATAEPGTGIIAASIAILRPLIRNIKSSVREHVSTRRTEEEDSIALTSTVGKKDSVCSVGSGEPWSPTVFGQANVQRVLTVQGGRSVVARV